MKLNWGHGIALFYGIFAISMIALVLRSTHYDHTLVTEKYYEQDLQYQKHYEKLANSQKLAHPVQVSEDRGLGALSIQFPEGLQDVHGKVTFYRPANDTEDFTVSFELDQNLKLEYDTKSLQPGLWTIQIDWLAGDVPYYQEVNIAI